MTECTDSRSREMNDKLYEKLKGEYDAFIDELKTYSPEQVLEHSYEKVFKEDILLCFENEDVPYDQAKALFSLRNPLDDLYWEWIGADCSYMDMLRDVIDDRGKSAILELKEKELVR